MIIEDKDFIKLLEILKEAEEKESKIIKELIELRNQLHQQLDKIPINYAE